MSKPSDKLMGSFPSLIPETQPTVLPQTALLPAIYSIYGLRSPLGFRTPQREDARSADALLYLALKMRRRLERP